MILVLLEPLTVSSSFDNRAGNPPVSAKKRSTPWRRTLRDDLKAVSFDRFPDAENLGIAIAARTATSVITISSSTRVKPLRNSHPPGRNYWRNNFIVALTFAGVRAERRLKVSATA
jgi:hypothetical protein